jgi:hypothetical protein
MRTKAVGLCLFLVLVPLSASAQPKKAPEFSATDAKETLLWLKAADSEYREATRNEARSMASNRLAWAKKEKEAHDKFDRTVSKAIGKKVTWSLTVREVTEGGIYIDPLRYPERSTPTSAPVFPQAVMQFYSGILRRSGNTLRLSGEAYFTHEGSEDWLLGLRGGDVIKVVGEIDTIHWSRSPFFSIYLKNAVVKPKD